MHINEACHLMFSLFLAKFEVGDRMQLFPNHWS